MKITVYLKTGQTITFSGTYEKVAGASGTIIRHRFEPERGFRIPFLPHDQIVAVTEEDAWS